MKKFTLFLLPLVSLSVLAACSNKPIQPDDNIHTFKLDYDSYSKFSVGSNYNFTLKPVGWNAAHDCEEFKVINTKDVVVTCEPSEAKITLRSDAAPVDYPTYSITTYKAGEIKAKFKYNDVEKEFTFESVSNKFDIAEGGRDSELFFIDSYKDYRVINSKEDIQSVISDFKTYHKDDGQKVINLIDGYFTSDDEAKLDDKTMILYKVPSSSGYKLEFNSSFSLDATRVVMDFTLELTGSQDDYYAKYYTYKFFIDKTTNNYNFLTFRSVK